MTQEELDLLLKDLCARLVYSVKIHYHYSNKLGIIVDEDRELDFGDVETLKYVNEYPQDDWCEISWKPYLRPMSSMTKEEKQKLQEDVVYVNEDGRTVVRSVDYADYLYSQHYDIHGLIPMGLALEAPADMYNPKQ